MTYDDINYTFPPWADGLGEWVLSSVAMQLFSLDFFISGARKSQLSLGLH